MQPSAAVHQTYPSWTVAMVENSIQVWARKPGNGRCIHSGARVQLLVVL